MCSNFLPGVFYNQLQHEGGSQILSRKSNLMIRRDSTLKIVACSKSIVEVSNGEVKNSFRKFTLCRGP